jgi:alkylation response protein AidB-like acyl-CoA dehydrogenase
VHDARRRAKIDAGDEARVEISLIKFYAARVLNEVIDRAVQVHGALGLTDRTPLRRCSRPPRQAGSTTAPTRSTAWSSAAES